MNDPRKAAIEVLAKAQIARVVARHLDVTGWPARHMRLVDKAAIRTRVAEIQHEMTPDVGAAEKAYDVLMEGIR